MKSRAEICLGKKKLDAILATFASDLNNDFLVARGHPVRTDKNYEKAREAIVELFKECVPEKLEYEMDLIDGGYDEEEVFAEKTGYNRAIEETLKNIEEMGR